jgi:hypothetical protein
MMLPTWVAVFVCAATLIQFILAMHQLATADRAAVDHQITVGKLRGAVPRRQLLRRLRLNRDLRALARENSPELRTAIRRIKFTILSWALLLAASVMALLDALFS